MTTYLVAVLAVTTLAASGALVWTWLRYARRLLLIEAGARRVADGNLEARLPDLGGGRVGRLGRAFNEMTTRLRESREQVAYLQKASAWQEIAKRLDARATEILDKLKGGSTFTEVAQAARLKVQTATGLKRGQESGPLSAATVDAVFGAAKNVPGKADAATAGEQIVFRVTDIAVPDLDMTSQEAKRLVDTLNRGISEDLFAEYIARLETEIGVTFNQSALNQVIGGGAVDAN